MTSTKTGAVRSRAASVTSNGHFKTIPFKGLKLQLPAKTKLRLIKQLTQGTQEEMIAALEELLGDEQMEKVWELDVDISKGLEALGDFLGDLALKVFEAYGSAGESPASSQR